MSADHLQKLTSLLSNPAYAGTASGFLIGTMLQPLEIIKICLIVNPTKVAVLNTGNFAQSFMYSTRLIYQLEGLKGFWRGLTPALIRIGFGNGVYFYSLDSLNKMFASANINKRISDFITSSAARTVSTVVINPFTVLKTRMELPGKQFDYKNMGDAIVKIYSKEGPKAFFRGISATMFRDVPFAGLYYSMLNVCKEVLSGLGANSSSSTMISGMFAGVIATAATHPFDLIRTHAQIDNHDIKDFKNANKTGMFQGLYKIHNEQGFQGLFKGLQARLLRKPLSNAMTFTFFEIFQGLGTSEKKLL